MRWEHPEHGLLPPDQFIPLAEQTGLIRALTTFVLDAALEQCRAWRREGLNLAVAVNITGRDLLDQRFAEEVKDLLRKWEVMPSRLELEITENTVLTDPVRARTVLMTLHELGVRLAIDDFGSGNSSLGYLKRLPIDVLKIDKSFVLQMHDNEDDAVIVRSTIDLGHNLGLKVVAEGVSSVTAWDRLRGLGCDVAQGYYLSKPVPGSEIAGADHRRGRARREPPAAGPRRAASPRPPVGASQRRQARVARPAQRLTRLKPVAESAVPGTLPRTMPDTTYHPAASRELGAYLAIPRGDGPWPGVVVVMDALGLSDDIKEQADRLAAAGYLAFAPDLYSGRGPKCVIATLQASRSGSGEAYEDIEAARQWLAERADCTGQDRDHRLLHGRRLRAAVRAQVRVRRRRRSTTARCPRTRRERLAGACPIVASYGKRDQTLRDRAERLEQALTELDIPHDVKEYPDAGHSFLNRINTGPLFAPLVKFVGFNYHHPSAEDAWRRILTFFDAAPRRARRRPSSRTST